MDQVHKALTICPAKRQDIPKILEIRHNTFCKYAPGAYSPKEVQTLLEDIKESELEDMVKNQCLFVAEKNDQLVGCGGWLGEYVKHMYVSPENTKQGIGSALLKTLEKDYQKQTKKSVIKAGVILYARAFYEKNGYKFIKLDTAWDGSKFNWMEKKLRTPKIKS